MRERKNYLGKIFSIISIIALSLSLFVNAQILDINDTSKKYHSDSHNLTHFDSAGAGKIAISGEPIYLGDNFKASTLVSNEGNNSKIYLIGGFIVMMEL